MVRHPHGSCHVRGRRNERAVGSGADPCKHATMDIYSRLTQGLSPCRVLVACPTSSFPGPGAALPSTASSFGSSCFFLGPQYLPWARLWVETAGGVGGHCDPPKQPAGRTYLLPSREDHFKSYLGFLQLPRAYSVSSFPGTFERLLYFCKAQIERPGFLCTFWVPPARGGC